MSERRSIILEVEHGEQKGKIEGFRFLWGFYLTGYNPSKHCQPCFFGRRAGHFCTPRATTGRHVFDRMERYPYLYICGVGKGPKHQLRQQNVHLPVRYLENGVVEKTTYNDYRFRLMNAELLDIPELPEGWNGKPKEQTGCKNFRFAVSVFGYPPSSP